MTHKPLPPFIRPEDLDAHGGITFSPDGLWSYLGHVITRMREDGAITAPPKAPPSRPEPANPRRRDDK